MITYMGPCMSDHHLPVDRVRVVDLEVGASAVRLVRRDDARHLAHPVQVDFEAPQPDLCFRCHQKADVALIPGHRKAIGGVCTDCHDPHASAVPKLLKVGGIRQDDPNQVN